MLRNHKNFTSFSLGLILFLFLYSCASSVLYETKITFSNDAWNSFDKLDFEFEVSSANEPCDVFIKIELTEDFHLQKLPLFLTLETPSGEVRTLEHSIKVMNNNGLIKGKKQHGVWKLSSRVYTGFTFTEVGKSKIQIKNLHYKYQTDGIQSVGILIEKSGGMMLR